MITLQRLNEKQERMQKVGKSVNIYLLISLLLFVILFCITAFTYSMIYIFISLSLIVIIFAIIRLVILCCSIKIEKQIRKSIQRILESTFENIMSEELIILIDPVDTSYNSFSFLIDAYGDCSLTYDILHQAIESTEQELEVIIGEKIGLYYRIRKYK